MFGRANTGAVAAVARYKKGEIEIFAKEAGLLRGILFILKKDFIVALIFGGLIAVDLIAAEIFGWQVGEIWWHDVLRYLGVIALMWAFVAPYHGAEHMAITAYNKLVKEGRLTGDESTVSRALLHEMEQTSPVQDKCGTRLWLGAAFGIILLPYAWINLYILLVFFTDWFIGLDKIPGIIHLSRFMQKHFLTRQPDVKHKVLAFLVTAAVHNQYLAKEPLT